MGRYEASYYIALYICGFISGPDLAVAWAGFYVTSRHSLVICSEEFNIFPDYGVGGSSSVVVTAVLLH